MNHAQHRFESAGIPNRRASPKLPIHRSNQDRKTASIMNSTLTIGSARESEKNTIPARSLIPTRSPRWHAEMLVGFAWVLAALYLVGAVALGVAFAVLHDQSMTRVLPF